MIPVTRAVTVRQFPQTLNSAERRSFLLEIGLSLSADRPCLVLDCLGLIGLDRRALLLLLNCLEQAMKRNGDVRLARVSPEARSVLQSTGVDRLFKIYDSVAEAECSFRRGFAGAVPFQVVHRGSPRAAEHHCPAMQATENAA